MADSTKADEEQEVRDSDADTKDVEGAEKTDEDETVRDADSDTKVIDSRLDALESMMQRMNGTLNKIVDAQSVLVESGAVVDTAEDDPADDDGMGSNDVSDVLNLVIN